MNIPLRLSLGALTLALWLWPGCRCYGGFDVFLKVARIDGESQDTNYPGYSRVLSFSFGVSQASGVLQSSGLTITKVLDKASPKLMEACAEGTRLPNATLIVRRSEGTNKVEVMKYTFTDILVASNGHKKEIDVLSGGPDGSPGTSAVPTEAISLNYGIIDISYQETDQNGAPVGAAVEGTAALPLTP